jgi:hypothetical protein
MGENVREFWNSRALACDGRRVASKHVQRGKHLKESSK